MQGLWWIHGHEFVQHLQQMCQEEGRMSEMWKGLLNIDFTDK